MKIKKIKQKFTNVFVITLVVAVIIALPMVVGIRFTGQAISEESTSITKTYIHAGTLLASMSSDEAELDYYIQDHLGSNVKVIDGQVEEQVDDYYAFGELRIHVGTENNDYKYTGKELDAETGLYYYGARYYLPEIGRFVQADALYGNIADPLSLNRYVYVKNNPLKFIDPSGNEEVKPGDANSDSAVNILDPVHTINALYKGGPESSPEGNVNADLETNVVDVIITLDFIYNEGDDLRAPPIIYNPEDTIKLVATAPGDDGMSGRVSDYDFRATDPEEENEIIAWSGGLQLSHTLVDSTGTPDPVPVVAGETQHFRIIIPEKLIGKVTNLKVKARDEVYNWGGPSNDVFIGVRPYSKPVNPNDFTPGG